MNTVCLIGKVKNKPEIIETSKGSKVAKILLDVNRNFPNSNGVIESEVYQVQLWRGIADQFKDCINPGMIVGIKGRLSANNWETSSGNKIYSAEIIAEHISIALFPVFLCVLLIVMFILHEVVIIKTKPQKTFSNGTKKIMKIWLGGLLQS